VLLVKLFLAKAWNEQISCCVSTANCPLKKSSTTCKPTSNCSKRHWWFALELRYLSSQLHEQNDCIGICSPSSTSIHDCDEEEDNNPVS
jgi:hypothetical protein